jgi:hypothetical protein
MGSNVRRPKPRLLRGISQPHCTYAVYLPSFSPHLINRPKYVLLHFLVRKMGCMLYANLLRNKYLLKKCEV